MKEYALISKILEECLNNVQKHSKATEAKVVIKQNNGQVTLKVTDNSIGLKKLKEDSNEDHLGLKGMKDGPPN